MTSIVGTSRLVRAEAFDASDNPQPAPYGGSPLGGRLHEQRSHDGYDG